MCHDSCPHPVRGGDALTEQDVAIPLVHGNLPAFLAVPDREPAPAVLLIHDIHGANHFYHDVARRLALAGYLTLLPDFFFRLDPPADATPEAVRARARAMEQSTTLSDLQSALLWLRHHERASGQLGTVGFCWGGTMVMLAATREPAPAASVAFYGFPVRERTPTMPILPADETEVANLQSPLLAFWGTNDTGVGMDNVDRYEAQLNRYGKAHDFVRYDGLPHGFLTFDETSPNYGAARDAWDRTIRFLDERLVRSVAS